MKLRDWLTLTPVFLKCLGKLPIAHLWYLARQFRYENPQRHNGRLHINAFFPPCPSPAFDRFVDAAVRRRRVPYSVYYAVTDACPYHCPHCSYGRHAPGRLEPRQAVDIVEQAGRLGAVTMGFTGGEPLLRDDLPALVAAASLRQRVQPHPAGRLPRGFTAGQPGEQLALLRAGRRKGHARGFFRRGVARGQQGAARPRRVALERLPHDRPGPVADHHLVRRPGLAEPRGGRGRLVEVGRLVAPPLEHLAGKGDARQHHHRRKHQPARIGRNPPPQRGEPPRRPDGVVHSGAAGFHHA